MADNLEGEDESPPVGQGIIFYLDGVEEPLFHMYQSSKAKVQEQNLMGQCHSSGVQFSVALKRKYRLLCSAGGWKSTQNMLAAIVRYHIMDT